MDEEDNWKIIKLNFKQRFLLKIGCSIEIGITDDGIPIYAFYCNENKEHGLVYDVVSGHYKKIFCPKCLKERGIDTDDYFSKHIRKNLIYC